MEIRLARIDDRLIHGQVALVWSKESGANRIIVISDKVANDEIRSTLVKQAAPPGIKVNVVSVEKAGRVFKNPKYESEKVFLLFENPEDVVRSIKEGIDITILNVGGMQYKDGKLRVSKAVFVNHDDIKNFDILHEQGVTLDGRVVASDPKLDFYDELTKIKIREEI